MELKKAVAFCLITFFSASMVVLIARALDLQGASRLEPVLVELTDEVRLLRKQVASLKLADGLEVANVPSESLEDGLVVYYFHSNTRCPTCESIEKQTHDALTANFSDQLDRGEVAWQVVNYEKSGNERFAIEFGVQMPTVVLAQMKAGELEAWKRLDQVWGLVGDPTGFGDFIKGQIASALRGELKATDEAKTVEVPSRDVPPALPQPLPLPTETTPAIPLPEIPTPEK